MNHIRTLKRLLDVFAECTGQEMPVDAVQQLAQLLQAGIPVKSYIYQEGIPGKSLQWVTIQTLVFLSDGKWLLVEVDHNADGTTVCSRRCSRDEVVDALESRLDDFEQSCAFCDDLEELRHLVIFHASLREPLTPADMPGPHDAIKH